MKVDVLKKEENPLLNRTLVTAKIEYEQATPKRADIADAIAKEVKVKTDLVVISLIRNAFGKRQSVVTALVYKDAAALQKVSKEYVKKRNAHTQPKEEKAEEPKAEPAEKEAPEEEKE